MAFNVICHIPTATSPINDIPFVERAEGGLITDPPVDEETAAYFRAIPGYEVVDLSPADPVVTADGVELGRGRPSAAQVAAWKAEIEELGGVLPDNVKGKAVAEFLADLKKAKAAEAAGSETAEPSLAGLAGIAEVDLEAAAKAGAFNGADPAAFDHDNDGKPGGSLSVEPETTNANGAAGGETQE